MEIAVLSQIQQAADAKGCRPGSTGANTNQDRCLKLDQQAKSEVDEEEEKVEE